MISSSEISKKIEKKIKEQLAPIHFSIVDETWKHAGHAGATPGKGHFIVAVVSAQFEGVSQLNRNRMIFEVLKEEMVSEIHALSIRAETPRESGIEIR